MEKKIELLLSCIACPEQYDAFLGSDCVGYIRLRGGSLTCEYLPTGELSDKDVLVYSYEFEDDPYKGSFDSDEEREQYLNYCKDALLEYIEKRISDVQS